MTEPPQNSNTGKSSAKQSRRISQNSPSLVVHDVTCEGHSPFSVASRSRATTNASAGCREIALGSSILSISPGVQITSSSDNGVAPSSNTQHGSGSVPPPPQQNEVRPSPSSIFSRTIQDLEGLLNEALTIARDAAEDHEVNCRVHLPELVGEPAQAQSEAQTSRETNAAHNAEQTLAQVSVPRSPRVPSGQAVNQQHLHKLDSVQTHGQANDNGQRRKSTVPKAQPSYVLEQDFAQPFRRQTSLQLKEQPSQLKAPSRASVNLKEPQGHTLRRKASEEETPPQNEARRTAKRHGPPPIHPRSVSKQRKRAQRSEANVTADREIFKNSAFDEPPNDLPKIPSPDSDVYTSELFRRMFGVDSRHNSSQSSPEKHSKHIDLNGCRHVDIKGSEHVNVHDSRRRQPVARDWAISRKQFAATTACINTALIGIIIGIYAGEVPAIQYVIVDLDHHIILGNVFFYIGLAIPTLFLWPLPLMHGRKPYIVMALALALGLQIPQGIAVSDFRSPQDPAYRKLLLLSRAISGFALGFVQINLQATLLDLFGASLQSGNPHQEVVDPYDVRRHGGGMGLWLGLWSGCSVGSISVGFFIGTLMVQIADVTWGFWITLILMMVVLLLNVIAPEVRRSAYRRTVAELLGEEGCISRVSRGEIKMHLRAAGPYWWGEEVKAGMELCWKMFRQGGFVILAVYTAWVYAHFTLILMLLGALASRYYRLQPIQVGLCVLALGIGALLATPFQKASFFSRARHRRQRTDSMTFQSFVVWSSHLVRRITFTSLLPVAGAAYTLASKGTSISVVVPSFFAGCVGFLSNLALAECQGIIMETFDTSDLQPGMTGRLGRQPTPKEREQRTNFTCYPRVSAGFAIVQSLSFCFAAVATGVCGHVERSLGAMQASGSVAGVLLGLTILLTVVLFRFRVVRMIPDAPPTTGFTTRSKSLWEPVILGRPSGTTRKISILESGRLTRWSEIRQKNRLSRTFYMSSELKT